jgi:hypothetical protein
MSGFEASCKAEAKRFDFYLISELAVPLIWTVFSKRQIGQRSPICLRKILN